VRRQRLVGRRAPAAASLSADVVAARPEAVAQAAGGRILAEGTGAAAAGEDIGATDGRVGCVKSEIRFVAVFIRIRPQNRCWCKPQRMQRG
jgi:hypothetical protein